MKIIVLATLMLTGCASVSDYVQGCRDGVSGLYSASPSKATKDYCDGLEAKRKIQKETEEGKR